MGGGAYVLVGRVAGSEVGACRVGSSNVAGVLCCGVIERPR
jgi:hypothetical protein